MSESSESIEADDYLACLDDKYRERLRRWAARALWLMPEQIVQVSADVVGGCGEGTCEFSIVEIDILTKSGQRFRGRQEFGSYFSEVLSDDLDDDGNFKDSWVQPAPLFSLSEVI